ncbi:MAG: methionine--tRNA ligase, partial [Candidatus Bathyarchaeota archaeon]|nr:methionine--tRNA ligase [Candidatus Bathyarchaeota archaeon]
MSKKFYLTTPLYYVNGVPHVGHVYTTVIADTLARYKRLCGVDVCALTGTDEHGLKIERAAQAQGMNPQQLTDKYAGAFQETWKTLGTEFDEFIRTTQERHAVAVREIARRIQDNGFIYLGEYSGNYCVSCEAYVTEGEEKCPDCGRATEHMTEESYFFKLSAFEEKLLHFYESNPEFVVPKVRMNEIVSFVRGGLRDISISRTSFTWGIPKLDDPRHIFYVWFDALTGYLSGIGFGTDEKKFNRCWPADVQLIGKDILRFHAVYWPAFLMAAGLEPPRSILVNGWWTVNGEKMSKSRGNFITAEELSQKLPADFLRYFLLREIPIGGDGDFSYEALVGRVNSDLAN